MLKYFSHGQPKEHNEGYSAPTGSKSQHGTLYWAFLLPIPCFPLTCFHFLSLWLVSCGAAMDRVAGVLCPGGRKSSLYGWNLRKIPQKHVRPVWKETKQQLWSRLGLPTPQDLCCEDLMASSVMGLGNRPHGHPCPNSWNLWMWLWQKGLCRHD